MTSGVGLTVRSHAAQAYFPCFPSCCLSLGVLKLFFVHRRLSLFRRVLQPSLLLALPRLSSSALGKVLYILQSRLSSSEIAPLPCPENVSGSSSMSKAMRALETLLLFCFAQPPVCVQPHERRDLCNPAINLNKTPLPNQQDLSPTYQHSQTFFPNAVDQPTIANTTVFFFNPGV